MYSVGSIILIKNIVFKNGNKCFDHAYKYGRPCLVISLFDNKIYFVTLSSLIKFKKQIKSEMLIDKKYCKKESKICLKSIYCTEGYYYEEKDRLSDEDLLITLKNLYNFQTLNSCDNLFSKIKDDLMNTMNEIANKLNDEKKLVYKYNK